MERGMMGLCQEVITCTCVTDDELSATLYDNGITFVHLDILSFLYNVRTSKKGIRHFTLFLLQQCRQVVSLKRAVEKFYQHLIYHSTAFGH